LLAATARTWFVAPDLRLELLDGVTADEAGRGILREQVEHRTAELIDEAAHFLVRLSVDPRCKAGGPWISTRPGRGGTVRGGRWGAGAAGELPQVGQDHGRWRDIAQ